MPRKLLLVDESVTIGRVVEMTFTGGDVQVIAVGNRREAIDRILEEQPDIVLADLGLDTPDGYELAAYVKGHPRLCHVPVLLLTGAFQPIDEPRAARCGCDGVLAKPFDVQSMHETVTGLLDHPRVDGVPDPGLVDEEQAAATASDPGPAEREQVVPAVEDVRVQEADPPADGAAAIDTLAEVFTAFMTSASAAGEVPADPSGGDGQYETAEPRETAPGECGAQPIDAVSSEPAREPISPVCPPPDAASDEAFVDGGPEPLPPAADVGSTLSLDDYFDLVDEILARPREAAASGCAPCEIPPFHRGLRR